MELVIEDAKFFKQCIDAIVNLVDEGSFQVTSHGIHLRTMDPSQIAMIDFTLPKEAFKKIDADHEQTIAVNLVDLSKILARVRTDDKLNISLEEKDNKLELEFSGASKRHFKLPLLDLNTPLPREPKIQFDSTIKIEGSSFKEMLKDAGLLSSHVVLQADDSELVVEAHGDSGDLRIETKKDGGKISEMKVHGKSRAMYPFEYLDDMTRACQDGEHIEVSLKTDAPVRIAYNVGLAKLAYYLAPRVETA
ncbi:MAG TPA: proliferating cell nuclear antigen (pcna) [Candidatus Norongarragalinales archaeon]|nr:proliferating cell nuclear antigen (pcna) [Candidatus Norongarragalinales archaeon]